MYTVHKKKDKYIIKYNLNSLLTQSLKTEYDSEQEAKIECERLNELYFGESNILESLEI